MSRETLDLFTLSGLASLGPTLKPSLELGLPGKHLVVAAFPIGPGPTSPKVMRNDLVTPILLNMLIYYSHWPLYQVHPSNCALMQFSNQMAAYTKATQCI